jgi:hypothetical protein
MYFNVFIDIVIGISPSHSHCNVFAMHTDLHIFFSLYIMTPFPTCYTTTFLFFHSRWSIPTFIQSILTFHVYTSLYIPHSMSSLVAWSIAEPKFIFNLILELHDSSALIQEIRIHTMKFERKMKFTPKAQLFK